MKKNYLYIILFICLAAIYSCYEKEPFDNITIRPDYPSSWGLALGKISIKCADYIFDIDTSIKQTADSLLYVELLQDLTSLSADELIDIPDIIVPSLQTSITTIPIAVPTLALPTIPLSYDFGTPSDDSQYIDSIILNSASLNIDLAISEGIPPATITLTFNNIIQSNNPLQIDLDFLEGETTYEETINLTSNDIIDFTSASSNNEFAVDVDITAYEGSRTEVGGSFSLDVSITDIDYSSSYGYFGRYLVQSSPQNLFLSVFDAFPEGVELIEEPEVKFMIENSFGLPISFFFNIFQFNSTKNSNTIDLTGSGVPTNASSAKIIPYPVLSQLGRSVYDSIEFNADNSNIDDAFHSSPNQINLSTSTYLNQVGYTNNNFVTENSQLNMSLKLELPLAAKIKEFNVGDTIPFSFGQLMGSIDQIREVAFKFIIDNGFPTNADLKVDLLDDTYSSIHTLIDKDDLLQSGKVEDGKVVEPSNYITKIVFSNEDVQQNQSAAYLSFIVSIQTTDEGNVWVDFYSFYKVKIEVGVNTKIQLDLNEIF